MGTNSVTEHEPPLRVVVWGTGNVGRPALRAVLAHPSLELCGVVVHNPDKIGKDVGQLIGEAATGILATDDTSIATQGGVDAVVYTVNADFRPTECQADVEAVLRSGANVVTTGFYPLYHPPSTPEPMAQQMADACTEGKTSVFASGIDPGWICDLLPLFVSDVCAGVTEIRSREIFNYALYDQPEAIRDLIGFGSSMDSTPLMLLDFSLEMVWGPMIRVMADGLGVEVERIETYVEKRALAETIDVPGMGVFEAATMGAFRFEVRGYVDGTPLLVIEHITRIHDACAPEWPRPPTGQGVHEVRIQGHPDLVVSVHGSEPGEPGAAGGGNAIAANRIVNAIPAVCAASPGVLHPLDVPPRSGSDPTKARRVKGV